MTPTRIRVEARKSGRLRSSLSLVATLLFIPPAFADVLVLKTGRQIEGRVRRLPGGSYEVFVEEGNVVRIPASEVTRHSSREAPVDRIQRELEGVVDRDALVELAAWSEDKGLRRTTRQIFRRILEIDPHHPGARSRLGYVLYQNRWVRRETLEEKGLVRFRGLWMTPPEARRVQARESIDEFDALLAEARSPNKYLRQNALARILENRDLELVPHLKKLLGSEDPLDRMLAARVLGNHPFRNAAADIYAGYLRERRTEVKTAITAVLRGFGNGRLGSWMARDFARGLDPTALENLIALARACPHRDVVPALIDLVSKRGWGSLADRTLSELLDVPSRDAAAWRGYWRTIAPRVPPDLGSGWIKSNSM